jgi:hypothetical protein
MADQSERDGDGGAARNKSLRDWFAGQALLGFLANPVRMAHDGNPQSVAVTAEAYAKASYLFADAMIAEGSK